MGVVSIAIAVRWWRCCCWRLRWVGIVAVAAANDVGSRPCRPPGGWLRCLLVVAVADDGDGWVAAAHEQQHEQSRRGVDGGWGAAQRSQHPAVIELIAHGGVHQLHPLPRTGLGDAAEAALRRTTQPFAISICYSRGVR